MIRWKFLKFAVSWMQFMSFFLSLCSCNSQAHTDIVQLIHNGVETKPAQWPWHATLFIGDGLCGGTFVDNNTILTAAHCAVIDGSVIRENDILVSGGRKYRDASTKDLQELNVAKIIVHPDYDRSSLVNDIAILKLTSDINVTNFVRPVSIWKADSDENQIFGSQGTVIGFGLDEDDELSDTLQQATIRVLDTQTCVAYDNETYGNRLTTKMYCAGGKDNVSACNGDSGGGMFFNLSDTWFLRGLVSFSPTRPKEEENLCDSSKPTVFTDITKYQKWIMRYTNMSKWLKDLKPCNGTIEKTTECNAATRFENDLLFWVLFEENALHVKRFSLNDYTPFNGRDVLVVRNMMWLDKDCVEGRLYWTESQAIFSAKYDGTDKKAFITKTVDPINLAVDWISRHLYWVDYEKHTIEVASIDNPDLRTTVIFNITAYDRIAVDPLQGKLFRKVGKRGIEWSNLDGSDPQLLLETKGIKDITVSIATGEVCYVNEDTSKIDCMDSRSKQIRTIVSNVTKTNYLSATDEMVFWSNFSSGTIESINQEGVRQRPLLKPNNVTADSVFLFRLVADDCPVFYSPCAIKNGGCPKNSICLPNARTQSGKICKSTIYEVSEQTDPSTIIKAKRIKPISDGAGKQRKWPWHATIYSTLINNTGYLCGGSIISRNSILTAAHCFHYKTSDGYRVIRENELSIRVGSDYVDGITDGTQVLNVAQVILHSQYNHSSFANNIAIVQLSTDMNITNFVRTATIWKAESGRSQLVGMNGTVVGFSLDEDGEASDKIRVANLNVIDRQKCLQYDNATYGPRLTSQVYCADGCNSNNICNGDDGGGMHFNINDTWYLRGLVSFSAMKPNVKPPACDSFKPTVFTDITKYRNWILRYTNTTKWIKALKPCKDGTIGKDTDCIAPSRFESGFLLVSQNDSVFHVPMNGDPVFNVSHVNETYNLAYDCVEGRVYWTESTTIFSAKYDLTDKKMFVSEDLKQPSYVVVDWISRRLYWLDSEKETIEAASLENPKLRATVYSSAAITTVFAVDPLQAKFYILHGYRTIMSLNLDGSEAYRFPELRSKRPSYFDMKFSMATEEICYIDDGSTIECANSRNMRIRTIISNLTKSFDLDVTFEMIYWMTYTNDIQSISHHGVRQQPLKINETRTSWKGSLTAVTNVCPVFYSPCAINNGDCPLNTLCLLNPSVASGKICKCTQNC